MKIWGTIFAAVVTLVLSGASWAADIAHHIAKVHIDPAKAHLLVHDQISFDGGGETTLSLSSAFALDSVTLDGKSVKVQRSQGQLVIDLGADAPHTLGLTYQGGGAPFLAVEGGFLDSDWLAQPEGHLTTWSIEGQTPYDPKKGGQKFVMPGKLMFETTSDGHYRASFQNFTASAPPVLITGPFEVTEKMSNGVRIRTYFHKELVPLAETYLDDTARYIGYYTGKVGPYPYPGFSIISGPAPVGWGLPGMTYMGRRVLALPFIRFTSLPHEVLHNWWGNAVEVDYGNGNWAEGLTTYQADHAMAESAREGGGRDKRLEWLRNYAALPSDRDVALTAFRSKTHDASQVVGYGKTAFVFHMLKTQLGADVFDKALQRFNRDNHLAVAGWPEIQAAFEAESGEKLDGFFYAWVEHPGAPDLKIIETKAEDTRLKLTLEQNQTGAPYPLHLPVMIETETGVERHNADMRTKVQTFTFATKSKAKAVHIDPDADVFRRLGANEAPPILRDVTLDPDTKLVALGSMELRAHARELAGRLLQARLRMQDPADAAKTVILAGAQKTVRTYLAQSGLPAAPKDVADRGDARAWTVRTDEGQTLLVVEAEDAAGFAALTRVLPHYKRRSYVIMENGKTTGKGTWPPGHGPLTVRLD